MTHLPSRLLAESLSSTAEDADIDDDFGNLMKQMMSMRGRLQAMPDDERRKAAGDFMLQIQDQLGLSDETSDDE